MLRINHVPLSFALLAALVVTMAMTATTSTEAFSVQRFGAMRTAASNANANANRQQQQQFIIPLLFARPKSKWDLLEDVDDDGEDDKTMLGGGSIPSDIPVATDMKYSERNVKRSHENFLSLRNIGGKDVCNDVYAKSPREKEEVWYVGKIAKISDVSLEDCIARQWNVIEQHACSLRPIELYPHRGNLELWTAPGDTELDVAYNRPEVKMTKMEKYEVTPQQLKNNLMGFQGEVYQEGEEGFRSWRKTDGSPARDEINVGGETRPPTEAEMEQLKTEVEGSSSSSSQQKPSVEDIVKALEQEKKEFGSSPAVEEINPGGETRIPTEAEMEQLKTVMEGSNQNVSVEDIVKALEQGKKE
jgi:hypothetical protein